MLTWPSADSAVAVRQLMRSTTTAFQPADEALGVSGHVLGGVSTAGIVLSPLTASFPSRTTRCGAWPWLWALR